MDIMHSTSIYPTLFLLLAHIRLPFFFITNMASNNGLNLPLEEALAKAVLFCGRRLRPCSLDNLKVYADVQRLLSIPVDVDAIRMMFSTWILNNQAKWAEMGARANQDPGFFSDMVRMIRGWVEIFLCSLSLQTALQQQTGVSSTPVAEQLPPKKRQRIMQTQPVSSTTLGAAEGTIVTARQQQQPTPTAASNRQQALLCPVCEHHNIFSSTHHLEVHLTRLHFPRCRPYPCQVCRGADRFGTEQELRDHCQQGHGIQEGKFQVVFSPVGEDEAFAHSQVQTQIEVATNRACQGPHNGTVTPTSTKETPAATLI